MSDSVIAESESQEWVDVQDESQSEPVVESAEPCEEDAPFRAQSAGDNQVVETGSATGAPAQMAFSDASSEHSVENKEPAPLSCPADACVGPDAGCDEVAKQVATRLDNEPICDTTLPQRQWSQTECHMNDIRYAEKVTACVPHRIANQKLKVLVTGQPETGRTTTIKNLFASFVQDPEWSPNDVSKLTMNDFRTNPEAFTTTITDRKDTAGHMSITYIIQETPGLKGDPAIAAEALRTYMHQECEAYAQQEVQLSVPRDELKDGRVDVVLYFLPTNARIGESDLDFRVINALSSYAPVIPLMCKADCLEEQEILQRKAELERLRCDGLQVFSFPEDILGRLTDAIHGLSRSAEPTEAPMSDAATCSNPTGPTFKLPFNIVSGTHVDVSVHQYWFVRKYRWADCEAYRTSNSDLRLLRQLLLEDGFWAVKDEADARFRLTRRHACPPSPADLGGPSTATTAPSGDAPASWAPYGAGDVPLSELRQSGRGTRFVPSWLSPPVVDTKAASLTAPMHPFVCSGPPLRTSVSTRGLGTSVRPIVATTTPKPANWAASTSPPQDPLHLLSMNSDDTEFNTLAGTSALAALTVDAPSSRKANPACPLPPAPSPGVPVAEEDKFDESMCMRATVADSVKGMAKNYRLTLKLEGSEKVLCLRIGDTEGAAIASVLRSNLTSRPSAYDATDELLKSLGCKLKRVHVTECSNTIFYARMYAVNEASGQHVNVDARPSDAINLAMRQQVPIFVNRDVVDRFAK